MPVRPQKPPKKPREPRRFPPSLAGSCLRYAVMEVLGFGRHIDPDSMAAMQAGSRQHKVFQAKLLDDYAMARIEVPLKDVTWGVSGRMDALLETALGPWVVEYKTVTEAGYEAILSDGPRIGHWAQLQLYLAVGQFPGGSLVVETRPAGKRRIFHVQPDPNWYDWIHERIQQVTAHQLVKKLPEREVSTACGSCDRWQRCFSSEVLRDQMVAAHPTWEPLPRVPAIGAMEISAHIVL